MTSATRGIPTHSVDDWKRIAHELLAIIETLHESDAKPTDLQTTHGASFAYLGAKVVSA